MASKFSFFPCGSSIALGMAWNLDSGFWNILIDTILGWIYVGYKVSQIFIKFYGVT